MTMKSGDRIIINGKPVVVDEAIVKNFVDGDALFGLSGGQILHFSCAENQSRAKVWPVQLRPRNTTSFSSCC